MLHAMLCEFEGVLAETRALRRRALASSFADDGLTLHDAVFDHCCAGRPTDMAVRAALEALGVRRDETGIALLALRADHAFTAGAAGGVALAPGARELVEGAATRMRLAVVTRAPRAVVQYTLALAGLEAVFACVVGAEDAARSRPAPDAHRTALARLARSRPVDARHALALEDALPGVRAARAAGVRVVAVGTLDEDARAEADGWIASLADTSVDALASYGSAREEIVG